MTWTGTARRRGMLAAVTALVCASAACGSGETSPEPSATATSAAAETTQEVNPDLAGRLDAAVEEAMSRAAIPGAIVGIWGPEGQYVRAFGVADESTRAPMQPDFYSRIGSETKTFTATAVLQLAGEGKLGLDDPISKFVEGVPDGDRITLRQLARMQSGLFNYSESPAFQQAFFADPNRPFTPEELLRYAFEQPAVFPPGEGWQYSNTNYILLGLVTEKISGRSLPDYIQERILAPLDMTRTSFPTDNAFPEPHAQGYTVQTADGNKAAATDWNPSWGWAAGAMISTLDDLRIWASALANGQLLTPAIQEQRLQTVSVPDHPPQDGYGLGLFRLAGWIGHNGSLPGYESVTVHLPERQLTMVILLNTDITYQGSEPSTTVATAITEVLTPDHVYTLGSDAQQPDVSPAPTTAPR